MGDLNKLFVGTKKQKFPGKTWNALVAGEVRDRAIAQETKLAAPPATKSPVHVRLFWTGEGEVDPGHCVKLGDVLIEPEHDASVPYSGITFRCSAFGEGESSEPYAITLGPISDPADGANEAFGWGVIPEAWWAKVSISEEEHTHAKPGVGTLLESGTSGLKILYKEAGTGEKWAVVLIGGGGGSSAKVAAAIWIVTTEISAASDTLPTITPGTGFAVQGEVDPDTGDLSPMDMTPVEIYNYDPGETYEVDTGIYVADVPGTDLTMVLSGHCNKYTAAPEDP